MAKFFGVDTRRGLMRAALAALATGGFAARGFASRGGGTQLAQEAEKLAQNVVQYQNTPKDGAKCSMCVNFVKPNACKIVAGTISPDGWCVAYAPMNG